MSSASFPIRELGAPEASLREPQNARGANELEVSVVVPTYRRPAMLERCLNAILAQRIDPHGFEIVVCDDGPDDNTRATVERLGNTRDVRIRYVPVTATQGPAGARNAGWRVARAPFIAFTDDDTEPDPQWLAAGVARLREGAAAVSGRIVVPLAARPTDYERDAAGLASAEFATANTFVRRSALVRIDGFDERFTAAWREDSDLQFALLDAGLTLARAEDAVVRHPVRPARWGVSLSQQRKSQFDALLYKKYPQRYRERIRHHAPWLYYAIVAAAVVAIASLASHRPVAATCAALLWLAMTAWFCAKRLANTTRTPAHVAEMAYTSALIPVLSIYWRLYGAFKFRVFFL